MSTGLRDKSVAPLAQNEMENKHIYVSEETLRDYMERKLSGIHDGESSGRKNPTIHKVPNSIRQGCHEAYEPELISIGPLHHHRSELKQMEHIKWKYLKDLIKRNHGNNVLKDFTKAMWELQEDVRKQYSVDIGMEAGELVEVLVLDGCFLIELFIKRATGPMGSPWGDANWNLPMLRNDLLLLENQIPFSVLITLFNIPFPTGFSRAPSRDEESPAPLGILDLVLHYICRGKTEAKDLGKEPGQIHHLLHLNHIYQLHHFNTDPTKSPSTIFLCVWKMLVGAFKKIIWEPLAFCFFFLVSMILMCKCPQHRSSTKVKAPRAIPSARNLTEAGIKFKKKPDKEKICCLNTSFDEESEKQCFLNVSFDEESGKLEIPFLSLQQGSISFFRNLIALEQCCSEDVQTHFTAYATFMDNIIDTAEDVEILVRQGIIESKLGTNEDVASLFNNICKGATLNYEQHYLADLFKRVNTYCDSDRHRWRAALVNSHFHNPWAVASVLVAVALLLLTLGATIATIWQTKYTVKSYDKQFH